MTNVQSFLMMGTDLVFFLLMGAGVVLAFTGVLKGIVEFYMWLVEKFDGK